MVSQIEIEVVHVLKPPIKTIIRCYLNRLMLNYFRRSQGVHSVLVHHCASNLLVVDSLLVMLMLD